MSANVGGEGVNLNIIITPMLDMSFQLLAFFVMTYHPNALEGHIDGALLPPAKIAAKGNKPKDKDEPPPPPIDEEPVVKDMLTVVVKAVAKGETTDKKFEGAPTRILLRKPENQTGEMISDTGTDFKIALERLKNELLKFQNSPSGNKNDINIEADPDLRHGYFVQVYDVCKSSKFKNIGFVAPPASAQGQ